MCDSLHTSLIFSNRVSEPHEARGRITVFAGTGAPRVDVQRAEKLSSSDQSEKYARNDLFNYTCVKALKNRSFVLSRPKI